MGLLGIIGASGWLGAAFGTGLLEKRLWPSEGLVLLNRSGPSPAYAAFPGVTWARDATELCDLCQTIILSVRPEDFPVAGFRPRDHLLISFMAAWSMAELQAIAPGARIVRAMPNGGATTGQSYTPWLPGAGVTADDRSLVARLMSAMGQEDEIATEAHLHYLSALSGSGAAYPALMARAMLDHAAGQGLPLPIAIRAVEAVICGSAGLLSGRLAEIPALLDTYHSYRGITAAGLSAAGAAGFETAIQAALSAACDKAMTMKAG